MKRGGRGKGREMSEEQVLLLMLRQIGLATLQWNCTEIFLIISEQQRSSGCLATHAGKAHYFPLPPLSLPLASSCLVNYACISKV